jgi:CBS domain-containing protein
MGTSIKEVMTRDVRACEPNATVADAAKLMAQEDVGPIPIVEDGRLVGIVTDRDIVVRVVAEGRDPNATTVKEIASTDLVTVSPGDDLDEVLNLLAERQVRRLPVVEGDRLVGIVAQADVARLGKDKKTGEVVEEISGLQARPDSFSRSFSSVPACRQREEDSRPRARPAPCGRPSRGPGSGPDCPLRRAGRPCRPPH